MRLVFTDVFNAMLERCRETLLGNKRAAFSRKSRSRSARRSRSMNDVDSMPTELPSCLAALAKVRSYVKRHASDDVSDQCV